MMYFLRFNNCKVKILEDINNNKEFGYRRARLAPLAFFIKVGSSSIIVHFSKKHRINFASNMIVCLKFLNIHVSTFVLCTSLVFRVCMSLSIVQFRTQRPPTSFFVFKMQSHLTNNRQMIMRQNQNNMRVTR